MQATAEPSRLILPDELTENKASLKTCINKIVEDAVNSVTLRENYFLVMHAKFDPLEPDIFVVSQLIASLQLPPFGGNTMVFFVSPVRGIVELLWMVPTKVKGEKLTPQFNTKGVAYLQTKGAMPS